MSNNIKGIKIQGRKFSNVTDFIFWENDKVRFSLVYGKNGSGKSTISDAFSCLRNNNLLDFINIKEITFAGSSIDENDKNSIHVFNEKFIDENIKIEENGINSIIMFGQQVDIDNKIQETEKKLEESKNKVIVQQNLVNEYTDESNSKSPLYYMKKCIALLKRDDSWAGNERIIKNGRANSAVTEQTIFNIIKNGLSEKNISTLQEEYFSKKKLFDSVNKDSIEITKKINLFNYLDKDANAKNILSKKIEKTELTSREKRIFNFIEKNGQELTSKAKNFFNSNSIFYCPFCNQDLSHEYKENLIQEFVKVLNKEVDDYQIELDSLKLGEISFSLDPYKQLDKALLQQVQIETSKFNKVLEQYNQIIEKRKNNVYLDFSDEDYNIHIKDEIIYLNNALQKLENARIQFNELIKNKNVIKNELLLLNSQIAYKQIESEFSKHKEQTDSQKIEIEKLEALKKEKDNLEMELKKLNEQKKSIKIAQEHINYLLQYVFFSKEKLSIETIDGIYQVKSAGLPVKPNQISCGERNILALCYFFTQLFNGKEQKKIYSDKNLLIIDDPVSSFDKENRVGVLSLLKYELQHFISGNPETKILLMTHDLMALYDIEKIAQELNSAKTCSYNIYELNSNNVIDFKYKKANEYSKLLGTIYSFANTSGTDCEIEQYIGNAIRRVVEAYSTFVYKTGIDTISFDEEILKTLPNEKQKDYFANLMYRIILNGESHSEEKLKSLEDFCNGISLEEKVRISKDIICFLYLLNPVHISKHLKTEFSGAEETIKTWCNALPS